MLDSGRAANQTILVLGVVHVCVEVGALRQGVGCADDEQATLAAAVSSCAEAVSLGVVVSCAQAQGWGDVVAAADPGILLGSFATCQQVLLFTSITSSNTAWAEGERATNGVVAVVTVLTNDSRSGCGCSNCTDRRITLGVSSADREWAGCEGCTNCSCGTAAAAANALAQGVFSTCGQRTKSAGVLDVVVVTGTSRDACACGRDDAGVLVVERIVCANGLERDRVLTTQIQRAPTSAEANKCRTAKVAGGVGSTGAGVESAFQRKVSIQTAAQIFNAFEADTVGVIGSESSSSWYGYCHLHFGLAHCGYPHRTNHKSSRWFVLVQRLQMHPGLPVREAIFSLSNLQKL